MLTIKKETNLLSARKRSKNYTTEEEVVLVDVVESHRNIIENKKSDAAVWKQKEDAWRKIEEEFAALSGTHRHWKALRDKYELIKRKSKTEMAKQKLETYRTGGGPTPLNVSTVSEKIASMLGDSATGLDNNFDSDALIEFDGTSVIDLESSSEIVDQKQMPDIKFKKTNMSIEENTEWSSWKPASLKTPTSKELLVGAKRKNLEAERLDLIIQQKNFYKDENIRAQEKHEQELISIKLRNEILQLELEEKNVKLVFDMFRFFYDL